MQITPDSAGGIFSPKFSLLELFCYRKWGFVKSGDPGGRSLPDEWDAACSFRLWFHMPRVQFEAFISPRWYCFVYLLLTS